MDTNAIISWGLAIMGESAVLGWILISYITGTSSGTEVPISIISGLVGVLTGKNIAERKMAQEMAQEETTPEETKTAQKPEE